MNYHSSDDSSDTTSGLSDATSGSGYAGSGFSSFNSGKFANLFEYKSKLADSKLISNESAGILKLDSSVLYEKDLWKSLPATGPYCSKCAAKNATRAYNSIMKENYIENSPLSGFFL